MEHDERDRRNSDPHPHSEAEKGERVPPPVEEGGEKGSNPPFSNSSSEGDDGPIPISPKEDWEKGSNPPSPGTDPSLIPGVECARERIRELEAERRRVRWALQLKLRVYPSVVSRLVKEFDPDAPAGEHVGDPRALDVTGFVAAIVKLNREIAEARDELRRAYRHRPKSAQELAWLAEGREKMRRMREAGQFEGRKPKPEFKRQRKSRRRKGT